MSRIYFKAYRGICWTLGTYLGFWALTIASERGGNWIPAFAIVTAMFGSVAWAGLRTRKY